MLRWERQVRSGSLPASRVLGWQHHKQGATSGLGRAEGSACCRSFLGTNTSTVGVWAREACCLCPPLPPRLRPLVWQVI